MVTLARYLRDFDSLHRKNTSFNPPFNQTIQSTSFQVIYTRATLICIDLST